MLYDNCLFRKARVGIFIPQQNDYIHSITGCSFYEMAIGVQVGQGQAFVRNSHFEGSTDTDIYVGGSTHAQSVRRCTSLNSRMFVRLNNSPSWPNNLPVTIQDCVVEGWKNIDGAVIGHFRGPTTMFDVTFKRPPAGARQTIWLANTASYKQTLIHSNVTTEGTQPLINAGANGNVEVIPAGAKKGALKSADQVFLKPGARGFGKIFDVRNYGANNTIADCGPAFQQAVDAAKAHGNGAVAYIPGGNWKMRTTVTLTGRGYVVSGAGFKTKLFWEAGTSGPMFKITDPQGLIVQRMNLGFDQYNLNFWGIHQVSTGIGSSIFYDDVLCRTDGGGQPRPQGMFLEGLKQNDKVLIYSNFGQVWVRNSSSATIMLNTMGYSGLHVDGAGQDDGFLGALTGLVIGRAVNLNIKDNLSFVAGDLYTESSQLHLAAEGGAGTNTGRITLCAPRFHTAPSNVDITINNYQGRVAVTGSFLDYMGDSAGPTYRVVHTGTHPLSVVYIGNMFMGPNLNAAPKFEMQPSGSVTAIGNIVDSWSSPNTAALVTVPNRIPANGMQEAAAALDHFRELGEMDLILNQGFVRT